MIYEKRERGKGASNFRNEGRYEANSERPARFSFFCERLRCASYIVRGAFDGWSQLGGHFSGLNCWSIAKKERTRTKFSFVREHNKKGFKDDLQNALP